MTGRDWNDDGAYDDAVQRAERVTRFGWAAIAGITGLVGCTLVAMAVICGAVVIACAYLVVAMN
jgi:hypothetical protein